MLVKSALAVAVAAAFAHGAAAQQNQQSQQTQQQQAQQGQQQRAGNTTVAQVRGQALFDRNGQRIGRIENVLLDQDNQGYLLLTEPAPVP